MKFPHFVLIALVVVGCSPKNSTEEKTVDSLATSPPDSLQNIAAPVSRIVIESGKATVFVDNKKALSFSLDNTLLIDNQSNDSALYATFNIEEDKETSLQEVSLVFTVSKNWVESEYIEDVTTEEINFIKWQASEWDLADMQSNSTTYQYRYDDEEGNTFVFQMMVSSSTYTDPEENVKPVPFNEEKYVARLESMLGSVELD